MGRVKKLLVANRGEIAVRIARACREMGIETVLAFDQRDDTRYVRRFFEEAVPITSYLDVASVIDAARATGADAIHPGYGFLSERADLAAACEESGIAFVGPKAKSIAAMGSKAESRRLMQSLGVPVVPGYDGGDQSDATLTAKAKKIGFPILVKASAGGGGKGMKIVRAPGEMQAALESARREALKAFGDDRLILERSIEEPRHVEVQVFGDARGEIIHLFERDCSIQRRHQKVVEESPAPNYPAELRAKMTKAAVAAARGVDYQNAGTVEFLLAPSGDFYFLEMNTRLQVEHPVTELVTGVDLVRAQIEVASGGRLPWKQEDIRQRGHAIEVRLYAEDPEDRFLPQSGRIAVYREPAGPGVRVDSGVMEGTEIGLSFDPMLAKLICYGEDREEAIDRLDRALRELVILGVTTNGSWLRRVVTHEAFRAGRVSTRFLVDHETGLRGATPDIVPLIAAALASLPHQAFSGDVERGVASIWESLGSWGRG
ncbi:MAG TPA: biotin carboxylase N-terminal domain-containing protein [Thermoanaerobaculia bacterium]|nr:biotin carboxylase N-terminal domain-containing protein [Thermoanaerobaculia bacterium]